MKELRTGSFMNIKKQAPVRTGAVFILQELLTEQ